LVAISPYGDPHPINDLINIELSDPFVMFYIYQLNDGVWTKFGIYDPYYKTWTDGIKTGNIGKVY